MRKTNVTMAKPEYLGLSILVMSKIVMYVWLFLWQYETKIRKESGSNGIGTHSHLVRKWVLNRFAKVDNNIQ